MGSSDKAVNVSRVFGLLRQNFLGFFSQLIRSNSSSEAYAAIRGQVGFGNFLAYQVLVDLLYPSSRDGGKPLLPFSHDDWAAAGPGAQRGIEVLCPDHTAPDLEVMRWLRWNQRAEFARLGLSFPFVQDANGREVEISLANIQNCLCEFYKYTKIKEGRGRGRRLFRPRPWEKVRQSTLIPFFQAE